jgi:ABC-2 type transport system ATP-binding protein
VESLELVASLDLEPHAHTLVRHASFGTKQKLAIVLALMPGPSLLLLDEVFNGLDFASGMQLRGYLRHRVDTGQLTILLATHSLDVVIRCCDGLALLHSGTVIKQWEVSEFTGANGMQSLENALASATAGTAGDAQLPEGLA